MFLSVCQCEVKSTVFLTCIAVIINYPDLEKQKKTFSLFSSKPATSLHNNSFLTNGRVLNSC